jgi:hypothetical protein
MTKTWEEAELASLQQEELQSYFEDIRDELGNIRGVLFMCGSYIHSSYTGYKYQPLNEFGKKTKYTLDGFQVEINELIEELDKTIMDIYADENIESDPYEGFSQSELQEEMYGQAADYYYEQDRDKRLEK